MHPTFAFLGALSPMHILIVVAVGILLFGKRLPEIGRTLGKGIVEFKKGLNGLEDEVTNQISAPELKAPETARAPQRVAAAAPRFDETV